MQDFQLPPTSTTELKLQRLNMDNSWRIEFGGLRILIDPWLQGVEVDYWGWFNTQWHRTAPVPPEQVAAFDLVIITQKYPDHFHAETLLALQPRVLIVPKSIEKKVQKLLPEARVYRFEQAAKALGESPLQIHYLPSQRRLDPIYEALVLEDGQHSILLATHGYVDEWTEALQQVPAVKLAITPFNTYRLPSFLGGTVSPGLEAVRNLIRNISPQHIVATHDEDKHAKGLIQRLAKVTFAPQPEVLRKETLFQDRLLHIDHYRPILL